MTASFKTLIRVPNLVLNKNKLDKAVVADFRSGRIHKTRLAYRFKFGRFGFDRKRAFQAKFITV